MEDGSARDVRPPAGREIVDDHDALAVGEGVFDEVAADEAGAAGDEQSALHERIIVSR